MRRGKTLTEESGKVLANDLRKRRFDAKRQRGGRRRGSGSGDSARHFKTPAGGVPAFNNTTKQMGSAECREWACSEDGTLTDGGNDEQVYNPLLTAIPADTYVVALQNESGLLVAIERPQASTFDVRVKPGGTALQKSTDGGTTWTDWATIGTC